MTRNRTGPAWSLRGGLVGCGALEDVVKHHAYAFRRQAAGAVAGIVRRWRMCACAGTLSEAFIRPVTVQSSDAHDRIRQRGHVKMVEPASLQQVEVAVIGAGPGGLAAAAMLKRNGFRPVVLERDCVGAFWRNQYERLHLHTIRWLSNLPMYHFPRSEGKWVSRAGVVRHLERYAAHFDLDVRSGVEVTRIDPGPLGWRLATSSGSIDAWAVVVATGYNRVPIQPSWPGVSEFEGELVVGSEYRSPRPYKGRSVLVVGAGNSGAEIAVDLIEGGASNVHLSIRTPPNITLRDGPIPAPLAGIVLRGLHVPVSVADRIMAFGQRMDIGDLSPYGMRPAPRGVVTQMVRDDAIPIIDVGLVDMLKKRLVTPVAAVERFDGPEVVLADGSRLKPDAVIACIGYRRGLEPLVGHLGLIGQHGRPAVIGGATDPQAPRLHFVGFKNAISGMFREFGYEAKQIARTLSRARRQRPYQASDLSEGTPATHRAA
jgi:putative flavoprotein involved in K+ transport